MSFSGTFELATIHSFRLYSFVLKCTKWFGSETVDCMISDEYGRVQPFYFREQTFKAGMSYRFDMDTVNWNWYQHDFFAILGKNDKIVKKWQLNIKEYGPGECPDCHGREVCKYCRGNAFTVDLQRTGEIRNCPHCGGTGRCYRCWVPRREYGIGGPPTGIGNGYR